ncbi:MAG: DUF1080 domain-containing protein [Oscillospiraceae bacterium]
MHLPICGKQVHKGLGFTLIELIVVIAVLGILVAVLIPSYLQYTGKADLAYDNACVKVLNDATILYALDNGKQTTQIFSGVSSDSDKMTYLLAGGYISALPAPKENGTSFVFSQEKGLWGLSSDVLFYSSFSSMSDTKTLTGSWGITEGKLGPTANGENKLLFNNTNGKDYTIKLEATYISGAANQSGYGIYYRATDSANISGYCFQFDPGAGSFTVRKVTNGKEANAFQKVTMSTVMGSSFNITAAHSVEITVTGTHQVIKIDGITVLDFIDSTFTEGSVGLRTWNNTKAVFSEATVTKY